MNRKRKKYYKMLRWVRRNRDHQSRKVSAVLPNFRPVTTTQFIQNLKETLAERKKGR